MPSNYPPGVTASDLPGFNEEDVSVSIVCQVPAVYATAERVRDALNATLEFSGLSPENQRELAEVFSVALSGHWTRGDEVDPVSICGFDGEADGVRDRGIVRVNCPLCGWPHEIQD